MDQPYYDLFTNDCAAHAYRYLNVAWRALESAKADLIDLRKDSNGKTCYEMQQKVMELQGELIDEYFKKKEVP